MTGELFSHYEILRLLGRGGMGDVFLARDLDLPRNVALKFLPRKIESDSAARDRFVREAQLACRVSHPYVCQVYEAGEVDGRTYIAMEYVEGETLHERLKHSPLPRAEALRLAMGIAQALEAIHEAGMVHRDLKPGNVMITRAYGTDRLVKVMDFGLAAPHPPEPSEVDSEADTVGPDTEPDVRTASAIVGTLAYMAPEQLAQAQPDRRSDIFSFGVLFYQMLTGEHPFPGQAPARALGTGRAATSLPTLTAALGSDAIPELLEHIVRKMMDPEPIRRYQSAREIYTDLRHLTDERVSQVSSRLPAVAVLPFMDESSGRDQEFLCDGIVEDLIYALERLDGLRVVPRTSAFRFRDRRDSSLPEIGRQLNVKAIVEGSLRKEEDRLRVTVRLVGVSHGVDTTLWSKRYERRAGAVFQIQDEITRAVAQELEIAFLSASGEPIVFAGTQSVEAYEFYLRARYFWNQRTESGLEESVTYFRKATERDPGYARAWAGLANSHTTLSIYGVAPPAELVPHARLAAERALALIERDADPQGANREMTWALAARACVASTFDWNWEAAERDFKRAIDLRPDNKLARHWYAMQCLLPLGRFEEARFQLRFAQVFDRDEDLIITTSLGLPEYFGRSFERAIGSYRKALETDPRFGMARYFLGLALAATHRFDAAISELENALELNRRSPETLAALAWTCAAAGEPVARDRARKLLSELEAAARERYVSPVLLAQVYAALGEVDRAFGELDQALRMRSTDLVWLRIRPTFDLIRSDPRFEEMCARIFPSLKGSVRSISVSN